jgi:hypothetical protein
MIDFSLSKTMSLMAKTLPFLVFRFLIYTGITLVYVLMTGGGAGIGFLVGKIGGNPPAGSVWGGLIGFGVVSTAVYLFREYLLYLVKAGHIAVLVELMEGKTLPGGRGQVDYAQKMVRERFAQSSVMFGLDQLIKGVIGAFNRAFFTIAAFIPIPGLDGLVKFINSVINLSLTYLDEVILAYNFRTRTTNPWAASQTALILYAQNYKAFLKNAFFMTFLIWGLTFVVFLVILAPAALVVSAMPGAAGPLTVLIALVFAWGVKQSVIEPIGMIALMQVFFKVTEGQVADPVWDERLNKVSKKFGEIKDKARDWAGNSGSGAGPQPADIPATPSA